jgi:hypothetical protein
MVCGPSAIVDEVRATVAKQLRLGGDVDYFDESHGW